MAVVEHIQYDELPYQRFTLGFDELPLPALNETDKVSMILKQGVSDLAVPLVVIDAATRVVEWRPASPENTATGTFDFRIRVTQADGKSYSHPRPEDAPWQLTIKPSTAGTDVVDAA